MGDATSFAGNTATLQAFGQSWTLSVWDLDIWDPFLDWARTKLPDPLDVAMAQCHKIDLRCQDLAEKMAAFQKLPAGGQTTEAKESYVKDLKQFESWRNQQENLTTIALKLATSYMSPDSEGVQSLIRAPRGAAHLLWLLLQANHPKLTENEAWAIHQAQPDGALGKAFQIVQGKLPPEKNEVVPAPEPAAA